MRSLFSRVTRNLPLLFWAALMLLMTSETIMLGISSWNQGSASGWTVR